MKKHASILIVFAISAALFLGCKKNERSNNQLPNNNTHVQTNNTSHVVLRNEDNWADAANPENPNDAIGLKHNQCMRYILDDLNVGELEDIENVYTSAATFQYLDDSTNLENTFTLTQAQAYYDDLDEYDELPSVDYMVEIAGLGTTASAYLEDLLDDLYNDESSSYSQLKAKIVLWESDIDNQSISNFEKSKLYDIGSVARYSLLAWTEAQIPSTSSGHVELKTTRIWGFIAGFFFDCVAAPAGPVVAGIASVGAFAVCWHNNW